MDGKIIYAKSPIAPKYLIEDYRDLYQTADPSTMLGHSIYYATRVNSFDENQRTKTIAYSFEYPVRTMFFNTSRDMKLQTQMVCMKPKQKWVQFLTMLIAPTTS